MNNVFVTGATGFLGSHFLNLISENFQATELFALVRADSKENGANRLNEAARVAGVHASVSPSKKYLSNNAILGDVKKDDCGIIETEFNVLKGVGIDEFWHFASSLNFEEKRKEQIYAANVSGAINAVSAAAKMKAKKFIYISTAYTSGVLQGNIPEQTHKGIKFHNFYEESKNQAESLILEECDRLGMEVVLLRPSIVIGPLATKSTGGSTTGFYGFIREVYRSRQVLSMLKGKIRIFGDPSVNLNLIPVDCLMQDISYLINNGMKNRGIYHLSAHGVPPVSAFIEGFRKIVGVPNISIELFNIKDASFVEKKVKEHTVFYDAYINCHKTFERSIPNQWVLSVSDLEEYMSACVSELRQAVA